MQPPGGITEELTFRKEQSYDISRAIPVTSPSQVLQGGRAYIVTGNFSGKFTDTSLSNSNKATVYIQGTWELAQVTQDFLDIIVLKGGKINGKYLMLQNTST